MKPIIKRNPKKWSFVIFAGDRPLMYYPYYFITKCRCKATSQILCDILSGNRICLYDSHHYPELFKDLKPVPNGNQSFKK